MKQVGLKYFLIFYFSTIVLIVLFNFMLDLELKDVVFNSIMLIFVFTSMGAVVYKAGFEEWYKFDDVNINSIKTSDIPGFDDMYENLVKIYSKDVRKLRRKYVFAKNIRTILLIIIILIFLCIRLDFFNFSNKILGLIIVFLIPMMVLLPFVALISFDKKIKLDELYKNEIIRKVVSFIEKSYEYKTEEIDFKSILDVYNQANFENKNCNDITISDYIEGVLEDNKLIQIADIDISYSTEGRNFIKVFEGMFVHFKSNAFIDGKIQIKLPATEGDKQLRKIEMNNSEFENKFDVYTSNEVITKIILYNDLLNKFNELREKFSIPFEIVLKGNDIYIKIYSKNMFEPNLSRKSIDKLTLLKYYITLKFTIDLAKELNLKLPQMNIEENNY